MAVCMKALLMLFNIILWIFGIWILSVSLFVRFIQLPEHIVEKSATALLALAGLGAIVASAATCASCCTVRGHPALLYLYGAFLAVVAVLQLTIGASIYAYRSSLNDMFDNALNESMAKDYGPNYPQTTPIDSIQSTFHCCGSRGYTDWSNLNPPKEIPDSCCRKVNYECHKHDTNDIYTMGCYSLAVEFLKTRLGLLTGLSITIMILFLPLIGMFLSCGLASHINKAKSEQPMAWIRSPTVSN